MSESKQAQIKENERLQKGIDEVKRDVKILDEKFDTHLLTQSKQDSRNALTLQEIQTTGKRTLEQATLTNGKIAEHEKRLNDLSPIVLALSEEKRQRDSEDSRKWRFWWEWGVRAGLFVLGIALVKLGILSVPLW